ncbi:MAG TPA: cytochrome c [Magnetococcales bacterium]|nr:cytochrome c [Magnetococcales bacterium]
MRIAVIGLLTGVVLFPAILMADQEADYRNVVMGISKLHLKAIDWILSGQVSHPEVLHRHARGFQASTELLPHLYESSIKSRSVIDKSTMNPKEFWKAVEDSQDAMTEFSVLADKFVESRLRGKKGGDDMKGLVKSFGDVKSRCLACHKDIAN